MGEQLTPTCSAWRPALEPCGCTLLDALGALLWPCTVHRMHQKDRQSGTQLRRSWLTLDISYTALISIHSLGHDQDRPQTRNLRTWCSSCFSTRPWSGSRCCLAVVGVRGWLLRLLPFCQTTWRGWCLWH